MSKEFKTIDELVAILESRGVLTDERTPRILQRESYYAIVNGYKEPFLDREAMQSCPSDVYLPGTTFEQIYDLFLFDRALRATMLPYLIESESCLKNAVVYAFCERYRETDAYLDRANYVSGKQILLPLGFRGNKALERDKRLADLMSRLNGKLTVGNKMRPFVRHYVETYGKVPLWVLQNDLTFGNVLHFYQLQKRGVQNGACRLVESWSGRRMGARELLDAFTTLVGFRNICAHGDRLYCADVKGRRFDEMVNALAAVLPRQRIECAFMDVSSLAETCGGKVDPRALNVMYTNPDDIPEEFRGGPKGTA